MKDVTTAKLLRIHIGEMDRARQKPLFEVLVNEARAASLSGATVLRGIESFGASSVVHRARLLELSEDLPNDGEGRDPPLGAEDEGSALVLKARDVVRQGPAGRRARFFPIARVR